MLNPQAKTYVSPERFSDKESIALALLRHPRGTEGQRSFLRATGRFFSHLFPKVVGLYHSSVHGRFKKLGASSSP